MKKFMLFLFLAGTVFAQDFTSPDQDQIPLSEFGPGGFYEANFMGEPLSGTFYASFPSKSATNGLNYTGLVTGMRAESFGEKGDTVLYLETENSPANVTLSLTSNTEGKVQNFVVTMLEWESRVINLNGYAFDNLHIITGEPINASLSRPGQRSAGAIDMIAPRITESLPACDFCEEDTQKFKMQGFSGTTPVWDYNASYWFVYIKRYEHNPVYGYWRIDVEYPNAGDTFHEATGSSTLLNPACKIYSASTKRVGGTKKHTWTHANGYDPLDDVLFSHLDLGYANCYSGCSSSEEFVYKRYVARHCDPDL